MKYLYNQSKTKIRFNMYVWCGVKLWKKSLLKHSLKLHKITYATFNFLFRVRFFLCSGTTWRTETFSPGLAHIYMIICLYTVCVLYILHPWETGEKFMRPGKSRGALVTVRRQGQRRAFVVRLALLIRTVAPRAFSPFGKSRLTFSAVKVAW